MGPCADVDKLADEAEELEPSVRLLKVSRTLLILL